MLEKGEPFATDWTSDTTRPDTELREHADSRRNADTRADGYGHEVARTGGSLLLRRMLHLN